MIYSLRGTPLRIEPFFILLDVGGVGYGVRILASVFDAFHEQVKSKLNLEIKLITRSIYSEDNAQIFGFLTEDEAGLFDFVRSLQGFGPSASMNILSTLGAAELSEVLLAEDAAALTKVPGVGKTKAEKLIFEARSKKKKLEALGLTDKDQAQKKSISAEQTQLIFSALASLGFNNQEISRVHEKISKGHANIFNDPKSHLQDIIRVYLQYL